MAAKRRGELQNAAWIRLFVTSPALLDDDAATESPGLDTRKDAIKTEKATKRILFTLHPFVGCHSALDAAQSVDLEKSLEDRKALRVQTHPKGLSRHPAVRGPILATP